MKQLIREQPTELFAVRAAPSLIRKLNRASQQRDASRRCLVRTFIERGLEAMQKDFA
jgi:hypothetical protein